MILWVNINKDVQINKLGFTLVDLDKVGHKRESFIVAFYAKQLVYVNVKKKGEKLFFKEKACMEVMKIKTQVLILLTPLSQHACPLTLTKMK
ncbi:hypothetical protein CR513_37476, partial [Mucuna pruriens]